MGISLVRRSPLTASSIHLAIADVEQSGFPQQGAHPLDQRQVQWIVGGTSRMDRGSDELAGGFGGGGHQLELGQIGAMVFAVAQLHEPTVCGGVEAVAGGAVESDPLQGEGVDRAGAHPEFGLDGVPGFGVAQPRQQQGEAVVGEIDVADGESGDRFQAVVELESPGADVGLAVVGLGEDVGDPESDEPTERKPLMMRVGLEVLVQEVGEPELSEEAEDQGDVIDPFVDEAECGRHGGAPTRYE